MTRHSLTSRSGTASSCSRSSKISGHAEALWAPAYLQIGQYGDVAQEIDYALGRHLARHWIAEPLVGTAEYPTVEEGLGRALTRRTRLAPGT